MSFPPLTTALPLLHDIGFVYGSDLLPVVSLSIVKGILGNPVAFFSGDHFQALYYSRNTLVQNRNNTGYD